jgi:hypothetical protein
MSRWRRFLSRVAEARERRRLQGRIRRALKLGARGALAGDHLALKRVSSQLQVEWCARDVHPWDRHLPVDRRTAVFVEQCLSDTVLAIERIFEGLAEVDVIGIRVVEPQSSENTILAGTVSRADLDAIHEHRSPGMRLKLLGIKYQVGEAGFTPSAGPHGAE